MHVAILGQGLAGSLLSFRLLQAGVAHTVIDRGHERASSYAAAGIINPITGRRFVRSWRIVELAQHFELYQQLDAHLQLQQPLLRPMLVLRDLSAPRSLNDWDVRRLTADNASFMAPPVAADAGYYALPAHHDWAQVGLALPEQELRAAYLPARVGPGFGYRLDLQRLLQTYREWLHKAGLLLEMALSHEQTNSRLSISQLIGQEATHVVHCTGAEAMACKLWRDLPWRGTKGEALRISDASFSRSLSAKRNHYICPVGEEHELWIGATNEDMYADDLPSKNAYTQLHEQANLFGLDLSESAETVEHLAAIRPTVRDRRPLVGQHPQHAAHWLCNGLGTKGSSLAPYVTEQLLNALLIGTAIDAELSLAGRFV